MKPRTAEQPLSIAFLGTYPPRQCGIATFTDDLSTAVAGAGANVVPTIVSVSDPGGQYEYGRRVAYDIRQAVKGDYSRAAELVNYSDVRLACVQHEYGIFGGDDGAYILDFLAVLRTPSIATLHTVLREPSETQRAVVLRMSRDCARLVVMSEVAARLLVTSYGLQRSKIAIIPHGIPALDPRDPEPLKAKFGVAGRRMLLTFGLLGPNKGIETVIRALPAVVAAFPDVVYFVVGATHPHVVRRQGEAYRTFLEREAERLGVRDHVVFRDQFVPTDELTSLLQAADIYLSPYTNEAQVTSGALSYAMGAGAAVVSTPYWHAQELLADGRGHLFPFGDHEALGAILRNLLGSPDELARVRRASLEHTRAMKWPAIGADYLSLVHDVLREAPLRLVPRKPPRASSLPELRLDHLHRLTDDTGIVQHATFTVPTRHSGYCVDDNARALIVALQAERLTSDPATKRLVSTFLAYLMHAQTRRGDFDNLLSYDRKLVAGSGSEDCLGRAIWALGSAVQLASDEGQRALARQMLERALPRAVELGPRGAATTMLGLERVLASEPGHAVARSALVTLSRRLVERYQAEATADWRWFEPTLTYDNALLPLALFRAYEMTEDRASLRVARESLNFLQQVCFTGEELRLVGNDGWHGRGRAPAVADEQAIDAAAFVLAFHGAYGATRDQSYLQRMRDAFAWFLGANRLGASLYDPVTAGCRDGLGSHAVNQNQGAESTICFLLALQEMLELAGEGLEHATQLEREGT